MSELPSSIVALVVALPEERLLLPNVGVAEVVAPDALEAAPPGSPPWYLGRLRWQGLELPVARVECFDGHRAPPPGRRARIVIVSTLGAALPVGRYGLLCEGYPRLATVIPADLQPAEPLPGDAARAVLGRAVLAGEPVAIPDLARIEAELARIAG